MAADLPAVQNRSRVPKWAHPVDSIYTPVLKVTYKVVFTGRAAHRLNKLILDVRLRIQSYFDIWRRHNGRVIRPGTGTQRQAEGIPRSGPSPAGPIFIRPLPIDGPGAVYSCLKREGCTPWAELVARTESTCLTSATSVRSPSTVKIAPFRPCHSGQPAELDLGGRGLRRRHRHLVDRGRVRRRTTPGRTQL